ncbi:MAG: amidohydrolase family protein [Betaproteobacteria bacterium]|nr:amidohydrolase family protein [Betaproteobacteria bacterium]
MHDLLIRGAVVHDGTGAEGRKVDVAVRDGRIAEVGRVDAPAAEVVDADGLALMPGIIDVHTHYDAQITWDPTLSPSPSLGVTTAILGNCGFGIAPCPAPLRETVVKNLSVVEGMDLDALLTGTQWEFESFGEYLAQLRRVKPYANVGVLFGHSTARTAVMGQDASTRAVPTAEELARMRAMVRTALDEGAAGFASSFSPNHAGYGGLPMPSTIASDAELHTLVEPLREAGRGVFVMATGPRGTPEYMEDIARRTGRPAFIVTVLTMYNEAAPDVALDWYERCAAAQGRGHEVCIHTSCQPLSFDFTLRDPYLLYSHSAFDRVKSARPDDLPAIYADPAFRAKFRDNLAHPGAGILFYGDWNKMELPDGTTVAHRAAELGRDPLDLFFDTALESGLDTRFIAKLFQNNDAGVAPLLRHESGVLALSDAGAHLIYFCDAGFGLHFLAHWVRETGTFTLAEGVRKLTLDPASRYRIPGRGRIEAGAWADLLLFDPATVGISGLERLHDLPGGGERIIRRPRGVHGVWVNGTRVFDGEAYVPMDGGPGHVLDRFDA